MSELLLIKLLVSPCLIGCASLAGKRWGPNIAGLLGGLPLVAGPLLLALWLMHGSSYAMQFVQSAPTGVWANISYMLVLGVVSARWAWYWALPIAWVAYLLTALGLSVSGFANSAYWGMAVVPGLWLAATRLLPKPSGIPNAPALPRIELITRMLAAAALVLSLSGVSAWFGPTLTGLLAGAPVAATVIPAFTFANAGRNALLLVLRGFLTGLMGFAIFFLILGYAMPIWGAAATVPALVLGVMAGFFATQMARRWA